MAKLKEVKTKISGVKKTRQITNAMKMVASSRLRGAQLNMEAFRPYAKKYSEVLGSLAERASEDVSPLLNEKAKVNKIHIVFCTSDKGLCGGFNSNLFKKLENFLKNEKNASIDISFTNFGKKGRDYCRKSNNKIASEYIGALGGKIKFNLAMQCGQGLINKFLDGTYDKVYIIYSSFVTMAKQEPTIAQLLPIPQIEKKEEKTTLTKKEFVAEHICEPDVKTLMATMLPKNVYIQIHNALLATATSENAARMTAMENATKACKDMISSLQTLYYKARQSAITADLMDIIGGANALKG